MFNSAKTNSPKLVEYFLFSELLDISSCGNWKVTKIFKCKMRSDILSDPQ